jgi:CheY-like chemotaxis protein
MRFADQSIHIEQYRDCTALPGPIRMREMSRVLVVDDSVLIRELLVATLAADGHEPRIAVDGVEAVRSVREVRPDLIILDWMMPRLDGMGCLRCLRRNRDTRNIPVIMLSGSVTREVVLEAAQHGIGGFYSKENLSLADLRTRIRELLAGGPTVEAESIDADAAATKAAGLIVPAESASASARHVA